MIEDQFAVELKPVLADSVIALIGDTDVSAPGIQIVAIEGDRKLARWDGWRIQWDKGAV